MLDLSFSLADVISDLEKIHVLEIGGQRPRGSREPFDHLVEQGKAHVHSFEPHEEAFAVLEQTHGAGYTLHPLALGKGGKCRFYNTVSPLCGSLYQPNEPRLAQFSQINDVMRELNHVEIDTVRLDDVKGIEDVDFIKIDVQGGELDVFDGGPSCLAKASLIQTEVSMMQMYRDQPLFGDVDCYLRDRGFSFHTVLGMSKRSYLPVRLNENGDDGVRQLLWGDVLYFRDFMAFKDMEPGKLKRLAVLLHDLYQSFDLALMVLGEADGQTGERNAPAYWARLQQS